MASLDPDFGPEVDPDLERGAELRFFLVRAVPCRAVPYMPFTFIAPWWDLCITGLDVLISLCLWACACIVCI